MITGDNPILRTEDDALGRAVIAQSFAQQVLALDATAGVVVGVLGSWGSGKTSFVNLARFEFERAGVSMLDFNPWMFSGTEQLVESFFVELASQLKIRPGLAELGKDLEEYGEMFSGVVGGAAKILGKILQRRKGGVGGRRAKLEKALTELDKPIVVVLDDIDRLLASEIRDIFRLVRLTASFPNIVYILAFDRLRIEGVLTEQGIPGRDYLEKILQVAVDLPTIPSSLLNQQIFSAVDSALTGIENPGAFDDHGWPDIFMEVIRPLIRNMRDVRRYAAAIHGTIEVLNGQIALNDVLALEAVRIFLPDVFARLQSAREGLTTTSGQSSRGHEDLRLKEQIEGLIQAAGTHHHEIVRAMIERLFPAGHRHIGGIGGDRKSHWLKERRVAHEDILRLYLERVAGESLQAFTDAERAWAYMADRDALDGYLRSLDLSRLQDVIASLEAFEDQFAKEHVVPGMIVLLNLLLNLPERQRGIFELNTLWAVSRVTYRLLRSLKDPAEVEAAVRQIVPQLNTLYSKMQMIYQVGYREDAGQQVRIGNSGSGIREGVA